MGRLASGGVVETILTYPCRIPLSRFGELRTVATAPREDPVAWFRRRTSAAAPDNRPTPRDDLAHLEQFIASRRGVEAYLEPKTTVTEVTVMLIAHDGEWTRRRVPSVQAARAWGNKMGIPVYDVALTGYPKRKRDYDERRKQERSQQS